MILEEWQQAKEQFDDFFPTAMTTFGEEFAGIWDYISELCNGAESIDSRLVEQLCRKLHTAKGTAAQTGFGSLAKAVHRIEDYFLNLKNLQQLPDFNALYCLADISDSMMQLIESMGSERLDVDTIQSLWPHLQQQIKQLQDMSGDSSSKNVTGASGPALKLPEMSLTESDFGVLFEAISASIQFFSDDRKHDPKPCLVRNENALNALLHARLSTPRALGNRLKRMVNSLSIELGKELDFKLKGFDTPVDRMMLVNLNEVLTHMLRNALDHGLESPDDRVAKGKSSKAILLLEINAATDRIVVSLKDDGAGIDPDRVCERAIEKGIIGTDEAANLSVYEKQSLIFRHGFSTKGSVTELSGRGVGMDAVVNVIENCGGQLTFESEVDQGTKFTIAFPAPYQFDRTVIFRICDQTFFVSAQYVAGVVSAASVTQEFGILQHGGEDHIGIELADIGKAVSPGYYLLLDIAEVKAALAVDDIFGVKQEFVQAIDRPDHFPNFLNGMIEDAEYGLVLGLDLTEIERNFNLYLTTEDPASQSSLEDPANSDIKPMMEHIQKVQAKEIDMKPPVIGNHRVTERSAIIDVLDSEKLLIELSEIVESVQEDVSDTKQTLLEYASLEIDVLKDAIKDINDAEELQYVVAIRYASLKANWILFNIQINYETAGGGEPSMLLAGKASILSCILGAIEGLVNQEAVRYISSVLAEPIRNVA